MQRYLIAIFIFYCLQGFSFIITKSEFVCLEEPCVEIDSIDEFNGSYDNAQFLKNIVKKFSIANGLVNVAYELKGTSLTLTAKQLPYIEKIEIETEAKKSLVKKIKVPLKTYNFVTSNQIEQSRKDIMKTLDLRGVAFSSVTYKVKGRTIVFMLNGVKERVLKVLNINCDNKKIQRSVRRSLEDFLYKKLDLSLVNEKVQLIKEQLVELGYYRSNISFTHTAIGKEISRLDFNVEVPARQVFIVEGVERSDKYNIKMLLKANASIYKEQLDDNTIRSIISSYFSERSYANPLMKIKRRVESEKSLMQKNIALIKIEKLNKMKVDKVEFQGNEVLSDQKMQMIFNEFSTVRAAHKLFDSKYYEDFLRLLKKEYAKRGFLEVVLSQPRYVLGSINKVVFNIEEGGRTLLDQIKIRGADKALQVKIRKYFASDDKHFNPIDFEQRLDKLDSWLADEGYLEAKLKNRKKTNLVEYKNQNQLVDIFLDLELGQKRHFENLRVLGNQLTKSIIIARELEFQKGDLLTQSKIDRFKSKIINLGLFTSVTLKVLNRGTKKADLILNVTERHYGSVEIAPGVRTDLGPKVSASIAYDNLMGMNRRISLNSQLNQRFSLEGIDEQRQAKIQKMIEYDVELNYNENKFLGSALDLSSTLSQSKSRFFSFDASIQKFSNTLTLPIARWLTLSMTQQLERIEQFDASLAREEGSFQIGSLTPSVTFDFRDSRIRPTRGTYFNLSYERAAPDFFSQDEEDLTIDYYKFVSRNFFYVPYKRGTLAFSVAAGVQKNLASKRLNSSGAAAGYIPNIKVFRLSGMDVVRGYEDFEMNALSDGSDISDRLVDEKAYMFNLKVEPRFFINDSMIFGLFYDAGRVFLDKMELSKLRSSAGVTFKYLTPVGTLDFDYGIKILSKNDPDDIYDSAGRLHVSIGFF